MSALPLCANKFLSQRNGKAVALHKKLQNLVTRSVGKNCDLAPFIKFKKSNKKSSSVQKIDVFNADKHERRVTFGQGDNCFVYDDPGTSHSLAFSSGILVGFYGPSWLILVLDCLCNIWNHFGDQLMYQLLSPDNKLMVLMYSSIITFQMTSQNSFHHDAVWCEQVLFDKKPQRGYFVLHHVDSRPVNNKMVTKILHRQAFALGDLCIIAHETLQKVQNKAVNNIYDATYTGLSATLEDTLKKEKSTQFLEKLHTTLLHMRIHKTFHECLKTLLWAKSGNLAIFNKAKHFFYKVLASDKLTYYFMQNTALTELKSNPDLLNWFFSLDRHLIDVILFIENSPQQTDVWFLRKVMQLCKKLHCKKLHNISKKLKVEIFFLWGEDWVENVD